MVVTQTAIILIILLILFFMVTNALSQYFENKRRAEGNAEATKAETQVQDVNASPRMPSSWWSNFWQGMSTEFLGAAIAAVLFTLILGSAQEASDREELRLSLIRDIGSGNNAIAIQAVEQLRAEGWLSDGTLNGANLLSADLRNADLSDAVLQGVVLRFADLRGANLSGTNLSNADLRYTLMQQANTRDIFDVDIVRQELLDDLLNFDGIGSLTAIYLIQSAAYSPQTIFINADLRGADLTGADLSYSDFRNSVVLEANFAGTNLYMSNFTGAIVEENLADAIQSAEGMREVGLPPQFDRNVMLPNGGNWSSSRDLTIFTDDANPDYFDPSPCHAFVNASEQTGVPSISTCPPPFEIIPYPPRQPGPFRSGENE
ncbi:MAG: pentapeptide repeat-containing protein [Chloroflexota bacterium]|nr:pentapeptide repeat-containing protein [Chloroflexota bacterium]